MSNKDLDFWNRYGQTVHLMGTYIVSNLDEIKEPFDALHTRYKPALPRFYDIVEYV